MTVRRTVLRMFRPGGPDRLVAVAVEPDVRNPEQISLKVQRSLRRGKPTGAAAYGPFDAAELEGRLADLADDLAAEGFPRAGVRAMIDRLNSPSARLQTVNPPIIVSPQPNSFR